MRKPYRKRPEFFVIAVQLKLDTEGFHYRKWDNPQYCKPGDWIVDNAGDVYSIDQHSFESTYEQISPGCFRKSAIVWVETAQQAGVITTRENATSYQAGDYLVWNDNDASDGYAVSKETFEKMYEPVPDDNTESGLAQRE
ncbi:MAG: hypothetical protein HKN42_10510 [Granulosicoccus sp.]|nr:hypothetical protein [Granulosicoccus sp.]